MTNPPARPSVLRKGHAVRIACAPPRGGVFFVVGRLLPAVNPSAEAER